MAQNSYNTDPLKNYDGPEFEEYCISEGKYLPASRDRTSCIECPLNNLCIPGFEEQVRRIQTGQNPSLTDGCAFDPEMLSSGRLLDGLTQLQIDFLKKHIPNL
jgi:hypothetical protein